MGLLDYHTKGSALLGVGLDLDAFLCILAEIIYLRGQVDRGYTADSPRILNRRACNVKCVKSTRDQ